MSISLATALIISGIVGALGTAGGAALNYAATEKANQTNVNLANTAHQREVQDLKDAGLNPWLSVQGSGAGGSVVANTAAGNGVQDVGANLSNCLSSIVNLKMMDMVQSAKNDRLDKVLSAKYANRDSSTVKSIKKTGSVGGIKHSAKASSKVPEESWEELLKAL